MVSTIDSCRVGEVGEHTAVVAASEGMLWDYWTQGVERESCVRSFVILSEGRSPKSKNLNEANWKFL